MRKRNEKKIKKSKKSKNKIKKAVPKELKNPVELDNLKQRFKIKFNFQDILQIVVGSFVLAVPVGFTQEVWGMAEKLPIINMIAIIFLTLFFIAIFTYYSYHREHLHANPKYHVLSMGKRILSTYIISFIIVAILMTSINVISWTNNLQFAFNLVAIVTFPAAIGAVISDRIK